MVFVVVVGGRCAVAEGADGGDDADALEGEGEEGEGCAKDGVSAELECGTQFRHSEEREIEFVGSFILRIFIICVLISVFDFFVREQFLCFSICVTDCDRAKQFLYFITFFILWMMQQKCGD